MKKALIAILVVGGVAVGWSQLSKAKLNIGFLQGKTSVVGRGDLTIPISGTGEIQPKSRSEIKPEASGEVVDIPVEPGQLVDRDALIIKLDPVDEQRNVTRALNDLERTKASLEQQRLRLEERRTSSLAQINARIASIKAQLTDGAYRLKKTKELFAKDLESQDVLTSVQARYDQIVAQRDGLLADRKQAEIAIDLADRDVILATKASESAETTLRDAEERLRETEIRAPISGMVSAIRVEVGEVVQGGRTTLTGGTVLAVVADISELIVRTEVSDADIGAVLWLAAPEARPGGQKLATELENDEIRLMVSTDGIAERLSAVGTPVEIHVDSFRDEDFAGVIERIYPEPKKIQNIVTYLVDIRVTSPNRRKLALVLGMQADVKFTAQSVSDALLIPHDSIRRGPKGDLGVYVPEVPEGKTESRPKFISCRFGLDNGLYAELLGGEGIDEGTEVYVELPPRFKRGTEDEDDT